MNVRKTIFVVGGIGVILTLPAIRLSGNEAFSSQKSTPRKGTTQTAVKSAIKTAAPKAENIAPGGKSSTAAAGKKQLPPAAAAAKKAEKELLGSGDPFNYAADGTNEYTPLSGNKNVGIITVKGIIRIEGEEPKAILHLKDSDRVHYVSRNSVVRVSSRSKKGTSPAEAYIVVKDIRNDEVELIQLERPDKVIIIR